MRLNRLLIFSMFGFLVISLAVFVKAGDELTPVDSKDDSINIESTYFPNLIEGEEIKHHSRKYKMSGNWIIGSENYFYGTLFPDSHILKDKKNLTISFELYNIQTGENISIIGDALVDKYFTDRFDFNLSIPDLIVSEKLKVKNLKFSNESFITKKVTDSSINSNNITQNIVIDEPTFLNYKTIKNITKFTEQFSIQHLTLDPSVSVCGTIDTAGYYTLSQNVSADDDCFTITGDDVVFDGNGYAINFSEGSNVGSDRGIYVNGADNVTIRNFIIQTEHGGNDDDNYGIYSINGGSNVSIYNNVIKVNGTDNNYGIFLNNLDYGISEVYNNTIYTNGTANNNFGIYSYLYSLAQVNIYNNTILTYGSASNYGIYTRQSTNTIISNNLVLSNGVGGGNVAVYIYTSNDTLIYGNNISANGSGNLNHGIYNNDFSHGSNITGNYIITDGVSSSIGIYALAGCDYNNIHLNEIYSYGTTISNRGMILNSNYNNVTGNYIVTNGIGNSNYGISIANYSYVYNNTIFSGGSGSNNYGVDVYHSNYNKIFNNTINTTGVSANYGIPVRGFSSFNVIEDNNITTYGGATASYPFVLDAVGSGFPHNNNFSRNVHYTSSGGFDFRWLDEGVNGTYLIDQYIGTYSFNSLGDGLNVKNTNFGEIIFTSYLTNSDSNLSNDIQIKNNSIYFNPDVDSGALNLSANITFYGIPTDATNYDIYLDGVSCPTAVCSNFTALDSGSVGVSVAHAPTINYSVYWELGASPEDSCTYSSGNWNVNFYDNCTITADVNLGGDNNLTISGCGGTFTLDGANVTNINRLVRYETSPQCKTIKKNGGRFILAR